jgi:hypothetical protein
MYSYISWSDEQLKEAGINKRKLTALVKKMNQCAVMMESMKLEIYAESGDGYLIHESRPDHDDEGRADTGSVVACVGYGFDGGGW